MSYSRRESAEELPCGCCPLAEVMERRAFLRDAAAAVVGVLAALGASVAEAHALPVHTVSALTARGDERTYPIPIDDGAMIDKKESIIIARWQGMTYAFSLACPHQNTVLRWEQSEGRFQCPKHHSKYRPDGSFIEGRATRGMDRFAIRRDGSNVVVDIDLLYRQDKEGAEWKAAFIQL